MSVLKKVVERAEANVSFATYTLYLLWPSLNFSVKVTGSIIGWFTERFLHRKYQKEGKIHLKLLTALCIHSFPLILTDPHLFFERGLPTNALCPLPHIHCKSLICK